MKIIRFSKADVISASLCTLLIIPGVSVYSRLPDRIATNFGVNGQPQQYDSKTFVVFGIPLIMTALQLALCFITNLFHKSDSRDLINKAIRFITPASLYVAQLFILLYALGQIKKPVVIICTFLSVLYVIEGNYMPKIRRNMFFGIITPHTLLSREVWDRTHRFSGILRTAGGIVMLPFSIMGKYIDVINIFAVITVVPIIYSEMIYRSEKAKTEKIPE